MVNFLYGILRNRNKIVGVFQLLRQPRPLFCSLISRFQDVSRPAGRFFARGLQLAVFSALPSRKTDPSPSATDNHTMAEFVGKYKLVSSENFDEYMKALDVGMVTRKMANAATPVTEVTFENGEFYIKTSTTFKTTEIRFKLGEEFDEVTGDGRKVKSTVTRDGNKLLHDQKGGKLPSTIVREFSGDTLKMILTAGDVVCTRVYKKE